MSKYSSKCRDFCNSYIASKDLSNERTFMQCMNVMLTDYEITSDEKVRFAEVLMSHYYDNKFHGRRTDLVKDSNGYFDSNII